MSLAGLKTFDVDRRRADRLRARCHASLRSRAVRAIPPAASDRRSVRRAVPSGIAGAWCALYLFEIIRRAVMIYAH
jgi:hypothetical protein